MSVSAFLGSGLMMLKKPNTSIGGGGGGAPLLTRRRTTTIGVAVTAPPATSGVSGLGLKIECSSRPQKKATAHHRKTRPKKSQPWDIKRGKTIYPPLPPLPAEWTLVSSSSTIDATVTDAVLSDSNPPQ